MECEDKMSAYLLTQSSLSHTWIPWTYRIRFRIKDRFVMGVGRIWTERRKKLKFQPMIRSKERKWGEYLRSLKRISLKRNVYFQSFIDRRYPIAARVLVAMRQEIYLFITRLSEYEVASFVGWLLRCTRYIRIVAGLLARKFQLKRNIIRNR